MSLSKIGNLIALIKYFHYLREKKICRKSACPPGYKDIYIQINKRSKCHVYWCAVAPKHLSHDQQRNLASELQFKIHHSASLPTLPQSATYSNHAEYVRTYTYYCCLPFKIIGSVAAASWPTAQTAPPAPNCHVATSKHQQQHKMFKAYKSRTLESLTLVCKRKTSRCGRRCLCLAALCTLYAFTIQL